MDWGIGAPCPGLLESGRRHRVSLRLVVSAIGLVVLVWASNARASAVAGRIEYYREARPVGGVNVRLTGSPEDVVQTDAAGDYVFESVAGGARTLDPVKASDFNDAVSALDAVLVLQAVVGLRTFDPFELLACDVTGNGTLSALDAVDILMHSTGLIGRFRVAEACESDWAFVPTTAGGQPVEPDPTHDPCQRGQIAFDSLAGEVAGQNFRAVLFGDCTGNWKPTAAPASNFTATPTATATATPVSASPTPTTTPSASPTSTATSTPTASATATPTPKARDLGVVGLVSGPTPCSDQECYVVEIACDQILKAREVKLKVGSPTGAPARGTIVFASGWIGDYYWEDGSGENPRIIEELRAAGFKTVQLDWKGNWFNGASGELEGHARLACRPASAMRWIYDNLHAKGPTTAFCATGQSNGASQVSYALAQYGLADVLSLVLLESGPNWARIDLGCFNDEPLTQALWYSTNQRRNTDWGFGYPNDGSGPCARREHGFTSTFQEASVAFGDWPYVYPHTLVSFVFGADDIGATAGHGMYFHDHLVAAGSPLVRLDVVPDAGHFVTATSAGADLIRDILRDECRPR